MPIVGEQWRQIVDMPGYEVSNMGRVRSYWRLRRRSGSGRGTESFISDEPTLMKLRNHGQGYYCLALRKGGEYHDFLLHRIVLEAFVGPCPEGLECRHLDRDKHNNRLTNICWGTPQENAADRILHGTDRAGTEAAALVTRGVPRTQEVRDKIAAGHRGKPKSDEHREAIKRTHWSKGPNAAEIAARIAAKKQARDALGPMPDELRARIAESVRRTKNPS